MATLSKAIVDDVIAGKYPEDTPIIRAVTYENQFNGKTDYAVIYQGEDPLKYHKSPACHNVQVYWDAPHHA